MRSSRLSCRAARRRSPTRHGGVHESFTCNGRAYRSPQRPTLAICIDGTAPAYLEDALERDLMPRLETTLAAGAALLRANAQVPTVTNANNATIVTGVSAAVHG